MTKAGKAAVVQPDEEPEAPILPVFQAADPPAAPAKGNKSPFSNLRLDLSDEELQSPVIPKILHAEVGRLLGELADYKAYHEKFHKSELEVTELRGKLKEAKAFELLSGGCLLAGGILLGLGPKLWDNPVAAVFMGIAGAIVIFFGVAAKVMKS